jgi:protocatechuate 3,4-dioxygenase beta subunit
MARVFPLALVIAGTLVVAGNRGLAAQTPPVPPPPPPPPLVVREQVPVGPRDQGQPGMRRIPIGTGVIAGTVTAADTGQPVRNARVSLNGTFRSPDSAAGGPAGAGANVFTGRGGMPVEVSFQGGMSSVSRTVITDAQGQFSFQKLPQGVFSLNANRNQYLPTTYGQKRPNGAGTSIVLADGQQVRVKLQMIRGGIITGVVLSEDGDPQMYANVRAYRVSMNGGFRRLQQTGGSSTDDRGVYRLFGLTPGEYIISATPQNSELPERMVADAKAIEQAIASGTVQPPTSPGMPPTVSVAVPPPQQGRMEPPPGYLQTFYPGTLLYSQAVAVQVNGGEERSGVDIQVQPAQASNITGMVISPLGEGVSVQVTLLNQDPMSASMSTQSTRTGPDGKFTFRAIAPGQYVVAAQTVPQQPNFTVVNGVPTPPQPPTPPRLDDSQKLWGRTPVTVESGQPAISVTVSLQAGRTISGVVQYDMARPPDVSSNQTMVTLTQAPSAQQMPFTSIQAKVAPDGRFTMGGVAPGRYILRGGGGMMKSAIVGGQDTLDFPLEVTGERDITDAVLTMTDQTQELTGILTDPSGNPAMDYIILAVAADTRFWTPGSRRIVTTRPDTSGRYSFRNLPPGDYLLATVTDLEPGGEFDPEFLKTLAGASIRVTLLEGNKSTQDIRVTR